MTIKMSECKYPNVPPSIATPEAQKSKTTCNNKKQKFVGNNQTYTFDTASGDLNFIGNDNSITVKSNNANIKIIGNCCKVKVLDSNSSGVIKVIGNHGHILLADGMDAQCVHCLGNNNTVTNVQNNVTIPKTNISRSSNSNCNSSRKHQQQKSVHHHHPGVFFKHDDNRLYINKCVHLATSMKRV